MMSDPYATLLATPEKGSSKLTVMVCAVCLCAVTAMTARAASSPVTSSAWTVPLQGVHQVATASPARVYPLVDARRIDERRSQYSTSVRAVDVEAVAVEVGPTEEELKATPPKGMDPNSLGAGMLVGASAALTAALTVAVVSRSKFRGTARNGPITEEDLQLVDDWKSGKLVPPEPAPAAPATPGASIMDMMKNGAPASTEASADSKKPTPTNFFGTDPPPAEEDPKKKSTLQDILKGEPKDAPDGWNSGQPMVGKVPRTPLGWKDAPPRPASDWGDKVLNPFQLGMRAGPILTPPTSEEPILWQGPNYVPPEDAPAAPAAPAVPPPPTAPPKSIMGMMQRGPQAPPGPPPAGAQAPPPPPAGAPPPPPPPPPAPPAGGPPKPPTKPANSITGMMERLQTPPPPPPQ